MKIKYLLIFLIIFFEDKIYGNQNSLWRMKEILTELKSSKNSVRTIMGQLSLSEEYKRLPENLNKEEVFSIEEREKIQKAIYKRKELEIIAKKFEERLSRYEISYITNYYPSSIYNEIGNLPLTSSSSYCNPKEFEKLIKKYSTSDLYHFFKLVSEYIFFREWDAYPSYYKNVSDLISSNKKYSRYRPDLAVFYSFFKEKIQKKYSLESVEENKKKIENEFIKKGIHSEKIDSFSRRMANIAPGCFKFDDPVALSLFNKNILKFRGNYIWKKILTELENKKSPEKVQDLSFENDEKVLDQDPKVFSKDYEIYYIKRKLTLNYLRTPFKDLKINSITIDKNINIKNYKSLFQKLSSEIYNNKDLNNIAHIIKTLPLKRSLIREEQCSLIKKLPNDHFIKKIGLKENDCLLQFLGRNIQGPFIIYKFLEELKLKKEVDVLFYRNYKKNLLTFSPE